METVLAKRTVPAYKPAYKPAYVAPKKTTTTTTTTTTTIKKKPVYRPAYVAPRVRIVIPPRYHMVNGHSVIVVGYGTYGFPPAYLPRMQVIPPRYSMVNGH